MNDENAMRVFCWRWAGWCSLLQYGSQPVFYLGLVRIPCIEVAVRGRVLLFSAYEGRYLFYLILEGSDSFDGVCDDVVDGTVQGFDFDINESRLCMLFLFSHPNNYTSKTKRILQYNLQGTSHFFKPHLQQSLRNTSQILYIRQWPTKALRSQIKNSRNLSTPSGQGRCLKTQQYWSCWKRP